MLITLTLALVLQTDWDAAPLFPTKFPNPTGANGMEEYTQAFDLLVSGHYYVYRDWAPAADRVAGRVDPGQSRSDSKDASSKVDLRYQVMLERLEKLDRLDLYSEEASAFRKAINLIDAGNGKPLIFPDPVGDYRFPRLSEVFGTILLGAHSAEVELSKGRSSAAVDDLSKVLIMSNRLGSQSYFATLGAAFGKSIVFGMIGENLDRFSLRDWVRFETLANDLLAGSPPFVTAFHNDAVRSSLDAEKELEAIRNARPSTSKVEGNIDQMIQALSDRDVSQMIQRIRKAISDSDTLLAQRFSGPENSWLSDNSVDVPEPPLGIHKTIDQVEAALTSIWTPPESKRVKAILVSLQSRAQMRLLRLHSRIMQFKWTWDRLPKNLEELRLPKDYAFDYLSHEPFVYELGTDSYRLFSKGWHRTNQIELGYSFPSSGFSREVTP